MILNALRSGGSGVSPVSRTAGCLLGLAIGDALGAPVEFMSRAEIHRRYGPEGVVGLEPGPYGRAGLCTDDTQMSLATARGCIAAIRRYGSRQRTARLCVSDAVAQVPRLVYREYLNWLKSQDDPAQARGPGNTCLSALRSGRIGSIERPLNNSKGCGGVMRTAPIGLLFPPGIAFRLGADCGAITHGHPSGYLTAGFQSELIALLVAGQEIREAIERATARLTGYEGHEETLAKVRLARELAGLPESPPDTDRQFGEGWVGDEALGVALCCALRYGTDWRAAVLAAVNRDGDSDSTGSITGAILGTMLGVEQLPGEMVREVENSAGLFVLAETIAGLAGGR